VSGVAGIALRLPRSLARFVAFVAGGVGARDGGSEEPRADASRLPRSARPRGAVVDPGPDHYRAARRGRAASAASRRASAFADVTVGVAPRDSSPSSLWGMRAVGIKEPRARPDPAICSPR